MFFLHKYSSALNKGENSDMQFNSYLFIMLFFPIFIVGYFFLNKISLLMGKLFIIAASLLFYIYGGKSATIIFGISIAVNLLFSIIIEKARNHKKLFTIIIVTINILLLLYYKYFNFAVITIDGIFDKSFSTRELILPIGISFFTFQQIMYVISVYKKEIEQVNIIDYLSYILYFPKLIMGPLIEATDFIKQLNDESKKSVRWDNIASGLKIFSYGLFKKMVLADTFSRAVSWGFSSIDIATSGDMFLVMLFYTFEIYFDFSGYTDMAVGISNMLNISFPMNFNSPYKALSIKDFWKRWHMSLTNFLTKYVYLSLGGNKKGNMRTYINIMIVFLISGFWHGANWTFVLWGGIYGVLQILERLFNKTFSKLFDIVKWGYTFLSINLLWLLFRADSITQWKILLKKMFTFQDMGISDGLISSFFLPENTFIFHVLKLTEFNNAVRGFSMMIFIISAYAICLIPENNCKTIKKINVTNLIFCSVAFVWGFLCLSTESVFVYFNF